jgi:hypothetical protein
MGRHARAASSAPRTQCDLQVLPKPRKTRKRRGDSGAELDARIQRIERQLYGLYDDLQYFIASDEDHRGRLRSKISWPDVGHITSLARALSEEDRFNEWVRFNRYVKVA